MYWKHRFLFFFALNWMVMVWKSKYSHWKAATSEILGAIMLWMICAIARGRSSSSWNINNARSSIASNSSTVQYVISLTSSVWFPEVNEIQLFGKLACLKNRSKRFNPFFDGHRPELLCSQRALLQSSGPCDKILLVDLLGAIDRKPLEFKSHIDRVSSCIGQRAV